jgi:hypothetical protein
LSTLWYKDILENIKICKYSEIPKQKQNLNHFWSQAVIKEVQAVGLYLMNSSFSLLTIWKVDVVTEVQESFCKPEEGKENRAGS